MDMDFKGNPPPGKKVLRSFKYAFNGIRLAFTEELNFQVHFITSIIVIGAGFVFSLSTMEWLILILLIAGMFALEIMNTAIERTVDLVTKEYHPLAGQAKDLAAGAVLCYAAAAVIIGAIIFMPKVLRVIF
ncbi:diacylglycerol kinase family protein [Bacillus sp. AK031]